MRFNTGNDSWEYGSRMPGSWHKFLGPCPMCGKRCFDYGGHWRCLGEYCYCSADNPVPNIGPRPDWWDQGINVIRDGHAWCARHEATFVNLQESPAGFGYTPSEAVIAYRLAVQS